MHPGLVVGGKYHVVRPIGRGGMGAVYDAVHAKTGRRVALKLIHEKTIVSSGASARARFAREARAAAAVDSLHVVQVLDSGEDELSGIPFIVMEYLHGTDLKTVLRRGPVPAAVAITIASQICMGLIKAHESGVVHRDLKPANVFLARTDGGRRIAKILDFGIAKLAAEGSDSADLTTTGDLIGSPPYMSPEQLRSPRDVDARTDLWAVGVILYEMLSGQVPTHGIQPIGARVYAICHQPAAPLRGVAPELSALVQRALDIDRGTRFQSAEELLFALQSIASGPAELDELAVSDERPAVEDPEPTAATAVGGPAPQTLSPPTESVGGSASTQNVGREAPPPRRRWLLVAGACLTVGTLGFAALRGPAEEARPRPASPPPPVGTPTLPAPSSTSTSTSGAASGAAAPAPPDAPPLAARSAEHRSTRPSAPGRRPPSKPRPPPAPPAAPAAQPDSREHL